MHIDVIIQRMHCSVGIRKCVDDSAGGSDEVVIGNMISVLTEIVTASLVISIDDL